MKKLIVFFAITLSHLLPAQTGYLVAIGGFEKMKPEIVKTADTLVVDSIVNVFLKTDCFSTAKALEKAVFVEYRQGNTTLYIERKTIKNGRYTKEKNNQ